MLSVTFICYAQKDSIGVYYETEQGLNKIEPIRYTQTKVNTLGAAFSMGLASTSIRKVYTGSTSTNVVSSTPVFYLYYQDEVKLSHQKKYYMFYASDTPRDIILAKFNRKKRTRELSVGSINAYAGMSMGTADDLDIEVEFEEIRDGVYKLFFNKPIENGEYCFLFDSPDGGGAYMYVFDFSVGGKNAKKTKNNKSKERSDMYL